MSRKGIFRIRQVMTLCRWPSRMRFWVRARGIGGYKVRCGIDQFFRAILLCARSRFS
jgi:hypothetical protein